MNSTHADGNLSSNNNEMEDEFDNCADDKVYVDETVITRAFMYDEPCDTDNKQGSIRDYSSINNENTHDLTVVVSKTEVITDYTNEERYLNETVISGGYIKEEPCDMKVVQGNIHNYLGIKDENIDDPTVIGQETELMTDDIDNKICVYETIISRGYIKQEPSDTRDESGSIHNNVNMKACEKCGEEYNFYCLKCPMLVRIFDSNNPDGTDNTARWTLPKKIIDIRETPSYVGVVALRNIPKGVVFGPFKGLDSTKEDTVSKWKLRNKELDYTKDCRQLNWMQYIRRVDQSADANLTPFQYEHELYYRSECHINVGDELLVGWDIDRKESEIEDMEDSYWEPVVCERLDDSYACTLCCVGYKSIRHLRAHNSICTEKRNKRDFSGEIVQCDVCKIYLDKKEYSDCHMDRCYKSNGKCVSYRIDNGDRPFSCTLCPYKTKRKTDLKKHIAIHDGDKPFACTLCPHTTKSIWRLKQHVVLHNDDKPFECILCPYKTKTKSLLKQHIPVHNDDKPFACTFCPYKTGRKSVLKQHIAVHNDDKPFACTLCSYKAKTKPVLKQHVAVHNNDKPFACDFCPYKARMKWMLKQHIATHNDDKLFACTLCSYKTKTKRVLKQHVAVHNDDKPFACDFCPYKARIKSILNQHVVIHNDHKPFACDFCPYKAKTKWMLKLHIATHNDHKPFACDFCPYKAKTKSTLKKHIVVHNDDKPFACTLCSYKAKTNAGLEQHVTCHNENDMSLR